MKSKLSFYFIMISLMIFSHFAEATNLSIKDQALILNQILPKPNVQSEKLNDSTIGRIWQINNQKLYHEYSQFSNSLKPKFAYSFIFHMMKYDANHMLVLFGTYIGETQQNTLPEMNNCHACSPILGIALFEKENSTQPFRLKELKHAVTALGGFGSFPEAEQFKLATIGKNQLGLEIYSSYGNMGISDEYFELIQIAPEFKSLLNITIATSNCSAGHPICENQSSIVKINQANSNLTFYPIEIHKTSEKFKQTQNDQYKTISKKKQIEAYRFDQKSFKYKLIR